MNIEYIEVNLSFIRRCIMEYVNIYNILVVNEIVDFRILLGKV